MIEKITILEKYRCLEKDFCMRFNRITPVVGDNGCGKSSLIRLISNKEYDSEKYCKIETTNAEKVSTRSFDFEKDNPRIKNNFGRNQSEFNAGIAAVFSSHGEFINMFMESLKTLRNQTIIMDEPDTALSIRSIYKMYKTICESTESNNNQIIFSIHNPLLIKLFENVYSLENKEWMSSKDFIASQSFNLI